VSMALRHKYDLMSGSRAGVGSIVAVKSVGTAVSDIRVGRV
jgi:hypothetical protein